MVALSRAEFERLVAEAFEQLPAVFASRLDNVAIVVEEWADRQTLRRMGLAHPAELIGLYHGVPFRDLRPMKSRLHRRMNGRVRSV